MKLDVYKQTEAYEKWRKDVVDKKGDINKNYLEKGLTKENSQLLVKFILDMETGINVSGTTRGGRTPKTLIKTKQKVAQIMRLLQQHKISDITKITENQLLSFFKEWKDEGHSNDYAKRVKSLWHWWMKTNRKKGKVVMDITEDLDTSETESKFVWLDKKEFDNYRRYFEEDNQTILNFCYDSIIRSPTELLSLKVENVFVNEKGEVWVDIPQDVSKTFGRRFNLVYSGQQVLKYIKRNKLKPSDHLFSFSPWGFNAQMQRIAKQLYGTKKSLGGELYSRITLYDMRHSGAIHFRQLFQKTGQSLDSLRHRGGWSNLRMINYYTKLLGLDGHIEKEKLLLADEKTKIEQKLNEHSNEISSMKKLMIERAIGSGIIVTEEKNKEIEKVVLNVLKEGIAQVRSKERN